MTELDKFAVWLAKPTQTRFRGLSDHTIKIYISIMKNALKTPDLPLHIFKKDLSASTRRLYRAVLLQWADFTKDGQFLEEVKAIRVEQRGTKPVKVTTAFTDEEMDRFYEVLDRAKGSDPLWVWPALRIFAHLGLRAGIDLCGLQKSALKEALRTGFLQLWTKRERRRNVPIAMLTEEAAMLVALPKWVILADLIAPQAEPKNRETTAYMYVRKWLLLIGQQAGIDSKEIQSRRFRNTAAQDLYKLTKDVHLVQGFLGHSSIETTVRYLNPDRSDELNEAMMELYRKRNKETEEEE